MANLNIPSTRDRTLDAFKGKMVGGGARPNLFECELFFPDDAIPVNSSSDEIALKLTCSASNDPETIKTTSASCGKSGTVS